DKRLSGTMELMSEGGLKERIIRVGKKLKHPHHSMRMLCLRTWRKQQIVWPWS
ncbi:hypothetical protein KI387_024530, partial [Taxus chinensis]